MIEVETGRVGACERVVMGNPQGISFPTNTFGDIFEYKRESCLMFWLGHRSGAVAGVACYCEVPENCDIATTLRSAANFKAGWGANEEF